MVGGGFKASALCAIYCRLPHSALALQPLYIPNPLALFNYEFLIFQKRVDNVIKFLLHSVSQ